MSSGTEYSKKQTGTYSQFLGPHWTYYEVKEGGKTYIVKESSDGRVYREEKK